MAENFPENESHIRAPGEQGQHVPLEFFEENCETGGAGEDFDHWLSEGREKNTRAIARNYSRDQRHCESGVDVDGGDVRPRVAWMRGRQCNLDSVSHSGPRLAQSLQHPLGNGRVWGSVFQ